MKRVAIGFCAVLLVTILAAASSAETILFNNGWYAQLTNVESLQGIMQPYVWNPNGWAGSTDSSLITIQIGQGIPTRFSLSAGSAVVGQENAYVSGYPALSNWFHGIRFNWESYWTGFAAANHLRLEVWGERWDDYDGSYSYDMLGTIQSGQGTRSGYSSFEFGRGYNRIEVHLNLTEVPEPSSLPALAAGVGGLGCAARRRRR